MTIKWTPVYHKHYFRPGGTTPTLCVFCLHTEEHLNHCRPPHYWKFALRRVLGTSFGQIKRTFRPYELDLATRFDWQLDGRNVVRGLLAAGYVAPCNPAQKRLGRTAAHYFLTARGSAWMGWAPLATSPVPSGAPLGADPDTSDPPSDPIRSARPGPPSGSDGGGGYGGTDPPASGTV